MKKYLLIILLLIFIIGCSKQKTEVPIEKQPEEKKIMDDTLKIEQLTLTTEDNVKLAATYYSKQSNAKAVLLLHMMNSNKEAWDDFAKKLADQGYNALAIDIRGHGQSLVNGKTWQSFEKDDFLNMIFDSRAAYQFLVEKNFEKIFVVGASIGANLALIAAFENEDMNGAVLLSPGLEYRDVSVEELVPQIDKPLFIIVGEKDEYAASSSSYMKTASKRATVKVIEATEAHGTNLFKLDIGVENMIIGWLNEH